MFREDSPHRSYIPLKDLANHITEILCMCGADHHTTVGALVDVAEPLVPGHQEFNTLRNQCMGVSNSGGEFGERAREAWRRGIRRAIAWTSSFIVQSFWLQLFIPSLSLTPSIIIIIHIVHPFRAAHSRTGLQRSLGPC